MDNSDIKTVAQLKERICDYIRLLREKINVSDYPLNENGDIECMEAYPYFNKRKSVLTEQSSIPVEYTVFPCISDITVHDNSFGASISPDVYNGGSRADDGGMYVSGPAYRILYELFKMITSHIAMEYELEHRLEDKDCRRMIFAKQVELLSLLEEDWAEKAKKEHEKILKEHPFDDMAGLLADKAALERGKE